MRMFIPESMSYLLEKYRRQINYDLNAPQSKEDAYRVLDNEVRLRKSDDYINQTRAYVLKDLAPPIEIDVQMQKQAMKDAGYDDSEEALSQHRQIVTTMSTEERKDVFFLSANDKLFKPHVDPVG